MAARPDSVKRRPTRVERPTQSMARATLAMRSRGGAAIVLLSREDGDLGAELRVASTIEPG